LYGDISKQKQNHDFKGWAAANSVSAYNSNPNILLASLDGTKTW